MNLRPKSTKNKEKDGQHVLTENGRWKTAGTSELMTKKMQILVYLFVPNHLYMFGAMFHLVHDTGRHQHRWTILEAVNTVKCY